MVLYNITISVDPRKSRDWLQFMREDHIPKILATGSFRDYKICRLMGEEEGGMAFAVMYTAHSEAHLTDYMAVHAPRLQAEHQAVFGSSTAAFRTTLLILEEGTANDHGKT
jgi:hypothetical protein